MATFEILGEIADLIAYTGSEQDIFVREYRTGSAKGGGWFKRISNGPSSDHNGGTIIVGVANAGAFRRYERKELGGDNQFNWGAHGNGTANDSSYIQNMCEYYQARSEGVNFAPGIHRLSSPISLTISNPGDFAIAGAGGRATQFVLTGNDEGAFDIAVGSVTQLTIRDLAIEAVQPTGTAYAIKVIGPSLSSSGKRVVVIDNIDLIARDSNESAGFFFDAIIVRGAKRPVISNVVYARGETRTTGVAAKANSLIDVSESFQAKIYNCWCNSLAVYGVKQLVNSPPPPPPAEPPPVVNNEGFEVVNCNFVRADIGVFYSDAAGRSPSAVVADNHINSLDENIHLDGVETAEVRSNIMYCNLDEVVFTYTQQMGSSVVSVESNIPHRFEAGMTFDVEAQFVTATAGSKLPDGSYEIDTVTPANDPASTQFTTHTATVAPEFRTGTFRINRSSRKFTDVNLLNVQQITVAFNHYKQADATQRRHLAADATDSAAGGEARIRDILVFGEQYKAESSLSPILLGEAANNVQIAGIVKSFTDGASYPADLVEFAGSPHLVQTAQNLNSPALVLSALGGI